MIRIEKLHKFFNKGRLNEIHVINDVNLELGERGMVAIFGKSGCGKTTLLNVIGGLDKYAEGSLTIEGKSISEDTDVIRNQYIGYIFQNYNLNKTESCFDNVADALRLCGMTDEAEIEARVTAALANVGMEKYAKRPPDTLSGGQQQRIAIARAIVKNPRIILADEPTGNLDEANTVMIMDLLKAISKDHLVILVTHEANLVDFYCDTVIELGDGKIVGVKQNDAANGFAARDKNDIWLGELELCELKDDNAEVEYYGAKPEIPIKLKIVNNGGKLYVRIDSDKVQLIDSFSEVKLREGVYEEKAHANSVSQNIDMSKLPSVNGTRFGELFTFKSSLKSGYDANFKNRKKGKKLLRRCMCLFAAVLVFMSASFGTAFNDIIEARKSYNHNVFYIYTPDEDVSAKLNSALGSEESAIDFIRLTQSYPSGDTQVSFRVGSFETFNSTSTSFRTNAVLLDASLIKDAELVEGKKDALGDDEIVITTRVADSLLDVSTFGYISERSDLIGLISGIGVRGKYMRIAGIVESKDSAIYMNELSMAKYMPKSALPSYTDVASDYGFEASDGEAILVNMVSYANNVYPKAGETVMIQGKELVIKEVLSPRRTYDEWIEASDIKKKTEKEYFNELLKSENPAFANDAAALSIAVAKAMEERHYEYFDYYYEEARQFYADLFFFEPYDIHIWLYLEKNVEIAKFYLLSNEYAKAVSYKNANGRYPTITELKENFYNYLSPYESIGNYIAQYEQEFYSQDRVTPFSDPITYLVSERNYVDFTKQLGETHHSAKRVHFIYSDDIFYEDIMPEMAVSSSSVMLDMDINMMSPYNAYYTVIHSNDPEKTEEWLNENFGDMEDPNEYQKALITPKLLFAGFIESRVSDIVTGLITMAVILVLMCICMYFIMRSSLMNRIKEIGIYRAIGVSKKNLIFKFFVEALLLATLTVFVGYLITSAFIFICTGVSALVAEVLFYPLWLALIVLAILYAASIFFGIVPIMSLLSKTPSEILAKYDI